MNGLSITIDSSEITAVEHTPITPYAYDFSPSQETPGISYQTRTVEAAQELLWNDLSALYFANEQLKSNATLKSNSKDKTAKAAGDKISKTLDDLLDSFLDCADAVLTELSNLGNAHPVLGIAIFALHEVVKLDIARRENNKKLLVVVMQMQSMMGPMFQLRNLDRDHIPPAERDFHEDRLKGLVEVMTRNIKECRSDISHFMSRKVMFKLVLAKGYEKKFATHMEVFALRRSELQSVISEYLALGVNSANVALAEIGKKLDITDDKLDLIISLFRRSDTPRERDVLEFLEDNGGPEKCVNDLDLLPKLISKAGESHSMAGSAAIYDQKDLEKLQKQLCEALREDLDKVLDKHYYRFEKILQVQNNNLKSMSTYLEDQGVLMQVHATKLGKILDTVTTIMVMEEGKVQTKAVKLKDPEIQRAWNQMNLTSSSVKAKAFVLTYRDHLRSDNSTYGTPILSRVSLPDIGVDSNLLQPSAPNVIDKETDLEWVLDYMDVAYVQPIVEAMDEDGSGFISVKEANSFALARPKGLSLLQWIAYWAAGWHINLTNLKKEMYSVLLEMFEALPSVHVANRALVDKYLNDVTLRRVEALLRSIKPLSDAGKRESKLVEVANVVASSQLERLERNLTDMGYFIESGTDATAIGGSARIETWILPLLLLLIRRHLKIIHIAKTVVLDNKEFDAHLTSLASVFAVFDERLENVEAKFRQLHSNVNARFENFSYGMFLAAFKKTELNTSENTLLSLRTDEYSTSQSTTPTSGEPHDTSILSKQVGALGLEYKELDISPSESLPNDHVPHPIEGAWLGLTIRDDDGWRTPFFSVIHSSGEKLFTGKGEGYFGLTDITNGKYDARETSADGRIKVTFDITELSRTCQGWYDPQREVIEGTFSWIPDEDAPDKPQDTTESKEKIVEKQEDIKPTAIEAEASDSEYDLSKDVSASGDASAVESEVVTAPNPESNAIDNPAPTLAEETRMPVGQFYLRRTPPNIFPFRYLLDGPGPAPCWTVWSIARKRWAFAIEAVLFQTRLRIGSRKAFLEVLAERRRWLYYAQRYYLMDSSSSAKWFRYEPLSDSEWENYEAMMCNVNPTLARSYETIGLYLMTRGKWFVGFYYCDACGNSLAFTRYQCIVCMEDDLSHEIDLCDNCFDKPDVVRGAQGYTHIPSHSLLRSRQCIHTFEMKTLTAESRLISERSKKIFREQEAKSKEVKELRSRKVRKGKNLRNQVPKNGPNNTTNESVQTCTCCSKPVTPPCWVCVSCSPLTFICNSCDRKSLPVIQAGLNHSRAEHHLLRIHDSVEVKPVKTNDMERQLEEINSNISALEEKVKIQLEEAKEMKGVVNEVAKTMGVPEDDNSSISESDDEFDSLSLDKEPPAAATVQAEVEGEETPSLRGAKPATDPGNSEKPGKEETGPTRPSNAKSRSQMDLMARISMLETKVESMDQNNQVLHDRYTTLGTKIDALEAKIEKNIDRQFEALLTTMRQLLSPPLSN